MLVFFLSTTFRFDHESLPERFLSFLFLPLFLLLLCLLFSKTLPATPGFIGQVSLRAVFIFIFPFTFLLLSSVHFCASLSCMFHSLLIILFHLFLFSE